VIWPENGARGHFVDIYDWDRLILTGSADNILSTRLVLCTGPLPCSVSLLGAVGARLQRVGNGSLACLGSLGCSAINVSRLRLVCSRNRDEYLSLSAPFEIEGAVLKLDDSFVLGCSSQADGGSIRAYGGATVLVRTINMADAKYLTVVVINVMCIPTHLHILQSRVPCSKIKHR
jgi:hypothetical protein